MSKMSYLINIRLNIYIYIYLLYIKREALQYLNHDTRHHENQFQNP